MQDHAFGAMPPSGLEWQDGKTAASISFVGQAERILFEWHLSAQTKQVLRDRVDRVKKGDEVIADFMTDVQVVTEAR